MPSLDPDAQRRFAVEVVEALRARGHEAYWAGGCVRDQLLGRAPKDYDVATSAKPEEIREIFGRRRTLALGAAFGVITVLGAKPAGPIDVATFRRDLAYSDGRHPDAVSFTSAEEDAERRDFTINGLFFDPLDQRVIDYVGGQRDLDARMVRAIGDPRRRFAEDKLRMLRGVRFACVYGFELEGATAAAIAEMAAEVTAVSVERIAAELRLMLLDASRAAALGTLRRLGLLGAVLPELIIVADVAVSWQATEDALSRLQQPAFPLALAILFVGRVGPAEAESIARRLKLSSAETQRAAWLVENQQALVDARASAWPALQRLLIADGAEELIDLHTALENERDQHASERLADLDFCRLMRRQPTEVLDPPPLIAGGDLIRHGVPRGPIYQQLLSTVYQAQLEERIHSPAEAMALVDRLLNGLGEVRS